VAVAKYIGAIDQGTTSTRFCVFDASGAIVAAAQKEHQQIYPQAGWVEHDPEEIWRATQEVIAQALEYGRDSKQEKIRAGDLFVLAKGVVLAQVSVGIRVRGDGATDRGRYKPVRLVAAAARHDGVGYHAGIDFLQALVLRHDFAFGRKYARHVDEVTLLDAGIAEGELEAPELRLVRADAFSEEHLLGYQQIFSRDEQHL
jgi:hypothetical protein